MATERRLFTFVETDGMTGGADAYGCVEGPIGVRGDTGANMAVPTAITPSDASTSSSVVVSSELRTLSV